MILYSLRNLIKSRDLVKYLVITNLKLTHRNMILGYLWWIITPFLWVVIYWLLIAIIFKRGEPNYALFLACALLPWRAFSLSVSKSITCISSQEKIIKQVAFPKIVLPISVVFSNSVNLLISIVVLIVIALFYGIIPTFNLLFLPLIILTQLLFTLGISIFFSIIGIYFVDIQNIMQFILRVWLYLSPSLYSIERVPENLRDIFMLNPFTPIFISYRNVIMYGQMPVMKPLFITLFLSFVILWCGLWFFSKQEFQIPKLI
ncbi:MAG: ABC-type polysaccharide/teichoic acid/polyol phosphate export permease [Thermodesulfobacteria bacterium]|nr:ABC-type polysaccharide/teichoic acid/polyol phosphate export permease [Thermodesulfobacteriota bacterium]